MLRRILALLRTSYTLTPRQLVIDAGVLSKSRKIIPVQEIEEVAYKQSFLERKLGIGDVIVESEGEWGTLNLKDLADCQLRTQQIQAVMPRER